MNTTRNRSIGRSILFGVVIGLSLAVSFLAGFFVRELFDLRTDKILTTFHNQSETRYPLLDEVQILLDQVFLRQQPDDTTKQYAAIRGLLSSLEDPNTFFIEPPVAQSEADALAGTYGGIGVTLQRVESGNFVLYPFNESPARDAGIQAGDILLAINGESVLPTDQVDAIDQKLRGEVKSGSGVEVTVTQSSGDEYTTFIEFDVINVPSVIWRVAEQNDQIGYVQLLRFTNRTPDELEAALQELQTNNIQGLILDLRDNSGGLLVESIDVASLFLDGGVVTYEASIDTERVLEASENGVAANLPLVVLVNGRTASASELVAGAIQDRGRGTLIGQRTFGKGTVQQIFSLSDGSSVHITSAEWLLPSRTPLDGEGLQPDIEMIPDITGRDVEFGEAIRYLQQQFEELEDNE